jgi:hypothetical protein
MRWGVPRGERLSEEREEWVRANVRGEMRSAPMRASVELLRKRYSPADITLP